MLPYDGRVRKISNLELVFGLLLFNGKGVVRITYNTKVYLRLYF